MEVFGSDKKKMLWEVVDDHFVEEPSDHYGIGLRGFDLNVLDEDDEGVVRKGSREFKYLLMLIKLWPVDWTIQLKSMNRRVDEDNGKALNKGSVLYRKI